MMPNPRPNIADPYVISADWRCGFDPDQRLGFWLIDQRQGQQTQFEFPLGVGMVLGLITPEMCELVVAELARAQIQTVFTQTFEECYTDLLSQQRAAEPLWLEESGGVMPIPFTIDQIQQSLLFGTPPASLRWLLALEDGTCWAIAEADTLSFHLTHLTARFDSVMQIWSLVVTHPEPDLGFVVAVDISAPCAQC
jgi:hypothetical protein